MTSSTLEIQIPTIRAVEVSRTTLTFTVEDGRSVSAPIDWYPRLAAGTVEECENWSLIGAGYGAHWPDLDEDISIEALLQGRRSLESERSFRAWLDRRPERRRPVS